MTALKIAEARTPLDRESARDICRSVFVGELGWPREILEGTDEGRWIALATIGFKSVGTGQLLTHEEHLHVAFLAVLPGFRRCGYGRRLLDILEQEAWLRGAAELLVRAARPGTSFFERCGYVAARSDESFISFQKRAP